jgi:hypothetical protein
MAAPDDDANASTVMSGTDVAYHGVISSVPKHPHITVAPPTYQSRRVKQASTIGAQTNSSVNASDMAAMIPAA